MQYRSEIDGLRAVAVLPVICFHAGFSFFSGGFLGVDVFFVISGYLITQLILQDLARGSFSLRRFYARRARRILPALFCVMLLCIPVAFLWMLPSQYEDFSRSLIAVVMFISNIFFWRESGYFAAAAEEKPLLHTWSLGVEEQYYVFFPLMLMLLWHFPKRYRFYGIVLGALASFAICEYASRAMPSANFFLLPTRAWELFAGSICALLHVDSQRQKNNLLSAFGLGLILFSMFAYDEHTRLPSAYALVPVLGTVLILLYGTTDSWAARLLSLRPFVGIGLISYSAYLWHQPLFAFARIRSVNTPSFSLMIALTLLSLVLAFLSWRLVEQPFRRREHPFYVANRPALFLAALAMTLLFIAGAHGYYTDGRLAYWEKHAQPNQVQAYLLIQEARAATHEYDNGDCIFRTSYMTDAVEERLLACRQKYGEGIAIIGDSHAMNMFFILKEHAGEKRPFIAGVSQGMCRPHSPLPTCYYDRFVQLLTQHPDIFHDVIYEQAGSHLFKDTHGRDTDQASFFDFPLDVAIPDFEPHLAFIDAVITYLSKIAPYSNVTWLGPRLEPQIRENAIITSGCDARFNLRPNQEAVFARLDNTIQEHLKNTKIRYHSQMALVRLDMQKDFISCEQTYFTDGNHYSPEGKKRFASRIRLQSLIGE